MSSFLRSKATKRRPVAVVCTLRYMIHIVFIPYIYIHDIQVEPGKPGAEVSKGKNLPIKCAQCDQPLRCPNRVFE